MVLNLVRKSAISDHLKSKTHTKRNAEFEEQNVRKMQKPLTASLQYNSAAQAEKVSVIHDFVKMCLEANIPLEKADHPAVRAFLSGHVKNGGSIPKSDQLRTPYLLMDMRMRISSSTHKIVDKAVMTIVIKINNVEY